MPGQLMEWKCPICPAKCNVPDTIRSVRCVCGTRVMRDGTVVRRGKSVDNELIDHRVAICESCSSYGKERCNKIEGGCRVEYQRILYAKDGQCPIGRWVHPMEIRRR